MLHSSHPGPPPPTREGEGGSAVPGDSSDRAQSVIRPACLRRRYARFSRHVTVSNAPTDSAFVFSTVKKELTTSAFRTESSGKFEPRSLELYLQVMVDWNESGTSDVLNVGTCLPRASLLAKKWRTGLSVKCLLLLT